MRKKIMLFIPFICVALACATSFASSDDIPTTPIPIRPDKIDLTGNWHYMRGAGSVSGKCPAGPPASGTISIAQQGSQVSLKISSGSVCRPASVCNFSGSISGNQLAVNNHAVVDDEGGNVTNAIGLVVISNESMSGSSSSRYMHPKGFECAWESNITLSRNLKDQGTTPSETSSSANSSEGNNTSSSNNGGGTSGSGTSGSNTTGGDSGGTSTSGGNTNGSSTTGGNTGGSSSTSGNSGGTSTSGGNANTGGNTSGSSTGGSSSTGGNSGGTSTSGGNANTGGNTGGSSSTGGNSGGTSTSGGNANTGGNTGGSSSTGGNSGGTSTSGG